MLDTETKKRIDSARDILVGKVPDPKSQVEQITIALIYKFMDDMDKEAVDFGGQPSFFTGDYEKYSWTKIFDPRLGGFDMLNLYSEALLKLNQNPAVPQLFRDIFKNAYLPYRDPETLKLFLKTINEFTYDHSERLGDAFEYLLSVLGSQGDAGQFRTPRHIIDFIVEVLAPKKGETICDPACGTAGFLISAYKHILKANTKKSKGDDLTPADKKALIQAFTGYDISPDMVRLSLVNMYLHGFTAPKVFEYDTLTSEDRWGETFDVILANPPFMSPKGGIKPHKKFSIQANRSEALFLDYIAEHIHPVTGRAAVIVPEGVIFKSETAFKSIRKLLVDKHYLYAVVSLPAGVFQPYSGVKTSILFMDKAVAKKSDSILFVKIEADGFDLGAQRRAIEKNDLVEGLRILKAYKNAVLNDEGVSFEDKNVLVVEKEKIKANADYNLSLDRYKVNEARKAKWEPIKLGDIAELEYGYTDIALENGDTRFIRITDITEDGFLKSEEPRFINSSSESQKYLLRKDDLLVARTGATFGKTLIYNESFPAVFASYLIRIHFDKNKVVPKFYWAFTKTDSYWKQANELVSGGGQPQFNANVIKEIIFPLPPLSIQQEIVSKIESYQRIIDGAKQVVEAYKPQIDIDPDWEMVELGSVCEVTSSKRIFQDEYVSSGIPFYRTKEIVEFSKGLTTSIELFISEERYNSIKNKFDVPKKGDILVSAVGTIGTTWIVPDDRPFYFKDGNLLWVKNIADILPDFLKISLDSIFHSKLSQLTNGAAYNALTIVNLKQVEISIPSIEIQQEIVRQIEKEQQLVNGNKELIILYEQKIKDEIAKLWQEGKKEESVTKEQIVVDTEA